MIQFKKLEIEGVYLVENFVSRDHRGVFVKTFHADKFIDLGFKEMFRESYYSQSSKGVLRGMHFQLPPHQHDKLVYVTAGAICDVILDLRASSPTFGQYAAIELMEFGNSVLIPKGCAHGFLTLSESATVVYNVTTVHNAEADRGIHWNSFGYNWLIKNPLLSERDRNFPSFSREKIFFE